MIGVSMRRGDQSKVEGQRRAGSKRLRLPAAGAAQQGFLRALARGASTGEELCATLELRYLLARLEKKQPELRQARTPLLP